MPLKAYRIVAAIRQLQSGLRQRVSNSAALRSEVGSLSDAYRLLDEGTTRGVSEQIEIGVPDTILFVGKVSRTR